MPKQQDFILQVSLVWTEKNKKLNTKFLPYNKRLPSKYLQSKHRHFLLFSQFGLRITATHDKEQYSAFAVWHEKAVLRLVKDLKQIPQNCKQALLIRKSMKKNQIRGLLHMLDVQSNQINTLSTNGYIKYHPDRKNSFTMTMQLLQYLGLSVHIYSEIKIYNEIKNSKSKKSDTRTLFQVVSKHLELWMAHMDTPVICLPPSPCPSTQSIMTQTPRVNTVDKQTNTAPPPIVPIKSDTLQLGTQAAFYHSPHTPPKINDDWIQHTKKSNVPVSNTKTEDDWIQVHQAPGTLDP